MGSCKSVKCRDVYQEWQHWHSQMAWPDLAYSIKMLWTACCHSQSQLVPWRRVLLSRSTGDFLGFTSLGQGAHVIQWRKTCGAQTDKAKEFLACSTGSKKPLGLLDCLEPILLLFQCAANLVWGNGPLAVGSPDSCLCPLAQRCSWVAQMLVFWHPNNSKLYLCLFCI